MTIEFLRSTRRTAKVRKEKFQNWALPNVFVLTANTGDLGYISLCWSGEFFLKFARSMNIASLRDGTGSKMLLANKNLSVCFVDLAPVISRLPS